MNPDDPRVQRTRDRLRAALLSLAAETDLGDVTMTAVARRAEVNRATVYQHYADLDALVADAMDGAVAHVARCAALCPLDAPRDRPPEPLVDLFGHVADRAVLYRRMLSDHGSARFANRLRTRLTDELAARFERGTRPPGAVPARTHAAYLAGALVGVIADWVGGDGDPGPAGEVALATWRLLRA
ncbi:TetR/AcrR family transcriptional regulator [Nocardiopsis halotolerans]|uniref:TetR/AcrR family transcriptional regulator n=1 Tax=Nocardiopsis halotolerans TaxID=124252 RepID=UPI00034D92F1|nr:TetR/AcrR family transcriptional regulator [Nocardiopsis halotolerans]